jgi:hypothetical protein
MANQQVNPQDYRPQGKREMRANHMYTVYHSLEKNGAFADNRANATSVDPVSGESLYEGPVPYPKMFYHPKGEEEVVRPASEEQVSPGRYVTIPARMAMITKIVQNEEEANALRAEGWHDNPADAVFARTGKRPPEAPQVLAVRRAKAQEEEYQARIAELEAENAKLKAEGSKSVAKKD